MSEEKDLQHSSNETGDFVDAQTGESKDPLEDADAEVLLTGAEDLFAADDDDDEILIFDADAEDAAEAARLSMQNSSGHVEAVDEAESEAPHSVRGMSELMAIIEALIFVADEPLNVKAMADVLKEDKGWIQTAAEALAHEF